MVRQARRTGGGEGTKIGVDARFAIEGWNEQGVATVRAAGRTDVDALASGLTAILHAATGRDAIPTDSSTESPSLAIPLRGSGADLPALFADLAADLLAQIDLHGTALDQIRLDGLLRTDDGLTAWGYAFGATDGPAPPPISLVGTPTWEKTRDQILLRFTLQRLP